MPRPRLRWTFLFAGLAQAIWMLMEAFQLLRSHPDEAIRSRPWARVVGSVGLDPIWFGPVFLVLGIAWLVVTIAILRGTPGARKPAVAVAVASLWYVVEGTALAVIYLVALATLYERTEEG